MSSPRFHIWSTFVSEIHKGSRWPLIKCKLFADDSSLFFVVCNVNTSADEVNDDLVKMNKWAMCFHPDQIKQAQEVIFTRKISKEDHTLLISE